MPLKTAMHPALRYMGCGGIRALALLVPMLAGCGDKEAAVSPESHSSEAAAVIRARCSVEFELADFWKPGMESSPGLDPFLAPVFYLKASPAHLSAAPGAVFLDENGRLAIDDSRPTVYFTEEFAQAWGGRRQLSFIWFRSVVNSGQAAAQGLRISYDPDGQPALVEVLNDDSGCRALFASERLESAATEAFGAPPQGQTYALENEQRAQPRVVLADVFGLGSMPTGPLVYLDNDSNDVVHVHCRCEASQVSDIRATHEYELAPLAELEDVWSPAAVPSEREWGPPGAVLAALRVPPDRD